MRKIKKNLLLFIITLAIISSAQFIRSTVYAVDENNDVIVVLDPGHGGSDVGCANSAKGLVERDINLRISLYTKAALEKYIGVKVYLTHYGMAANESLSIYERGEFAYRVNADIVISQHINDIGTNATTTTGAEVYVTRSKTQKRYNEDSTRLGNIILNKLGSLGIKSRGVKTKDSEENYYSDGTLADWYGMIRYPMYHGIPGMIIEHCFIKSSDSQYIDSDAKLQLLGQKDAESIAEFYGLNLDNGTNVRSVELNKTELNINKNKEFNLFATINPSTAINKNVTWKSSNESVAKVDSSGKVTALNTGSITITATTQNGSRIARCVVNVYNIPDGQTITTDLTNLKLGNNGSGNYIYGNVKILEWTNGIGEPPSIIPKITLKSTDREISVNMYTAKINGGLYYFDKFVDSLDTEKDYHLEASLIDTNIIGTTNRDYLGKTLDGKIVSYKSINGELTLRIGRYEGEIYTNLTSLKLDNNGTKDYIYGYIRIEEWINGVPINPSTMPKMTLKSTDGEISINIYIVKIDGYLYYFDKVIDAIDIGKEYYVQVELSNINNVSTKKTQNVKATDMITLGNTLHGNKVSHTSINGELRLNTDIVIYEGEIRSDLKSLKLGNTGTKDYIYGYIAIKEWISGIITNPSILPKMTLRSTDGEISINMYIAKIDAELYYFDKVIDAIDISKEYYIQVELINTNNISTKKIQNVKTTGTGTLGNTLERNKVSYKSINGELRLNVDTVIYEGTIRTDLTSLKLENTGTKDYIYGYITIEEWINGVVATPGILPKMTLKSTDGTVSINMYIVKVEGRLYYFDKVIDTIDISKEYYIQVELTNINNISAEKSQVVKKSSSGYLGETLTGKIVSYISVDGKLNLRIDKYEGEISTYLTSLKLGNNGAKDYIYGYITIEEWISGVVINPSTLPKMTLKSTDGQISINMYIVKVDGRLYYFDKVIDAIDISKEYYIQVELTNTGNISTKKIQNVKTTETGILGSTIAGSEISYKGIDGELRLDIR